MHNVVFIQHVISVNYHQLILSYSFFKLSLSQITRHQRWPTQQRSARSWPDDPRPWLRVSACVLARKRSRRSTFVTAICALYRKRSLNMTKLWRSCSWIPMTSESCQGYELQSIFWNMSHKKCQMKCNVRCNVKCKLTTHYTIWLLSNFWGNRKSQSFHLMTLINRFSSNFPSSVYIKQKTSI